MANKSTARIDAVVLAVGVLAAACSSGGDNENGQVGDVPSTAGSIMSSEPYEAARWSYQITPLDSDTPVASQDEDMITPMGSNTKLYTVGTWVEAEGTDKKFSTPVHKVGDDLVLVASGDLVMGGREANTGTLGYSIPPQPDANGLPGAKPAPGDPLAGLDDLARQVAKSGVKSVNDVEIDDRLFQEWTAHEEVISPIVINDNLLAIQSSPASVDQPAKLKIIPDTKAFEVKNQVKTVASGSDTQIQIVPANGGQTLIVEGTIEAGSDPLLNVFHVPDPATYARTLFIEALERASVTVSANPNAKNSTKGHPKGYAKNTEVASIASPSVQAIATLIWKISHNYGANLAVCLLAVQSGSTDCEDGFPPVQKQIKDRGIGADDVWMLDGSGESFSSTTPKAIVTWIKWLRSLSWGDDLHKMLPILGVDGSLKLFQTDTESTGKIQAKTGTWAGLEPGSNRLLIPAQTLAGLMTGADGKEYVFGLYASGASFDDPSKSILQSAQNVADVAAAFQASL